VRFLKFVPKYHLNIQRAIYFHAVDNRYIITHGFTKKSQKTPINEIKKAQVIKKEFEGEQKNENN